MAGEDTSENAMFWIVVILLAIFLAILLFTGFSYFSDGYTNSSDIFNNTNNLNYTTNLTFLNGLTKFVCDDNRDVSVCTQQYDPVCGVRTDNENLLRTYPNSCYACQDSEVQFWVEGACHLQ